MSKSSKRLIYTLLWLMVTCLLMTSLIYLQQTREQQTTNDTVQVFTNTPIKYGASNDDVRELQGRLKHLGFFNGKIDGIFGWQTLQALKTFQRKFGMKVDGIAGAKTKLKLWEATKNWRPTTNTSTVKAQMTNSSSHAGLSANDLKIMANAVYGEARGEPFVGQVAVAAVILNRLESASFPNTVPGVIFQPGAFTAVADGQIWLEPNDTARKAVQDAINGFDPTGGAIYYFNPETATSKWIWTRPQILQIGKHIFCM